LRRWGKLGECLFSDLPALAILFTTTSKSTPSWHIERTPPADGVWAGDRIICVGDYVEDVPEGMLSEEKLREFAQLTREAMEGNISDDSSEDDSARVKENLSTYITLRASFSNSLTQCSTNI
jgi:hypothetical protein